MLNKAQKWAFQAQLSTSFPLSDTRPASSPMLVPPSPPFTCSSTYRSILNHDFQHLQAAWLDGAADLHGDGAAGTIRRAARDHWQAA